MPKTVVQIQKQIKQKQDKKTKLTEESKKIQKEVVGLKTELIKAKKLEAEKKKQAKAKKIAMAKKTTKKVNKQVSKK